MFAASERVREDMEKEDREGWREGSRDMRIHNMEEREGRERERERGRGGEGEGQQKEGERRQGRRKQVKGMRGEEKALYIIWRQNNVQCTKFPAPVWWVLASIVYYAILNLSAALKKTS